MNIDNSPHRSRDRDTSHLSSSWQLLKSC